MQRYLLVLVLFCWFFSPDNLNGQVNLVPNPSFEDSTNCQGLGLYMTSSPWFNCNMATPDYFSMFQGCGVYIPTILGGPQLPKHGYHYVGLYYFQVPAGREYLEIELLDTLEANHLYDVICFVLLAKEYKLGINRIEACFSDTIVYNLSMTDLVVNCNSINLNSSNLPVIDTINWVKVSANYIANGNEKYLTIGNFQPDSLTQSVVVNANGIIPAAYYYVDSVSVTDLGLVGLNDIQASDRLEIVPNPVSATCVITSNGNDTYALYSSIGQLIKTIPIVKGENSLDFSDLSSGIYLFKPHNYKQKSVTFIKL
jgi:OmpA-OmpF porin, OOP family